MAGRGTVLYTADTEPVAALLAPEPLFRELSTSSSDGRDIEALEQNLTELGYGSELTVDGNYDPATAAAVKKWERDLGRGGPDGVVSIGEVVFLPEPAAVTGHRADPGSKLHIGTAVMALGTESRVVEAKVDVQDRSLWGVDTVVRLSWNSEPKTGTVTEVGREEIDGQIQVVISLPQPPDLPNGTQVEAEITTEEKSGVVSVPVSAVVEGPGGPSVRMADRDDRPVPVKLGIVSDGLVEISQGLEKGTKVRLPG